MKFLKKYEKYNETPDTLKEEDYDEIENRLFSKFKENNIEPNANALYFELKLIKSDPKQSYLLPIIRKYCKEKYNEYPNHDGRHSAIKFFYGKYGEILQQFKLDQKAEFDIKNSKKSNKIILPFNGEMIDVPNRIGHNYIPIKILPLEELQTKYSRHKRLKVFAFKGLKCVRCDRVGEYLIATKDRSDAIHIDLYTKDFELMTVDHIKPKWLGGTYDIDNLDPMCSECNTKKGGDYEDIECKHHYNLKEREKDNKKDNI